MNMIKILERLFPSVFLMIPTLAYAHAEDDAAGFISGFSHPLLGPDHLLAMLGVGLVSARLPGHYIWTVPSLFVAFMVIGGMLGAAGIELPLVEWGIALSVVVIGIAITVVRKTNIGWLFLIMTFVAIFGSLHGHAHGMEMPGSVSPVYYSFGFIVSTSTIHLIGVAIGYYPSQYEKLEKLPKYIGSAIALAGCYILYGLTSG